jgi:hypothetical protein
MNMYELASYTLQMVSDAGYHDFAMNHSEEETITHIWKRDQQLAKDFAHVMGMNGLIKELKVKTGK